MIEDKNIFDWRDKEYWLLSVNDYAKDLLNQGLLNSLKQRNLDCKRSISDQISPT